MRHNLHWSIPPILEGDHVTLEPLQPDHGDALLAAAGDGELWNLWFTSVPGPESVRAYVAKAIADREAGVAMPFLVRDASGEPVGSTRYFRMDPDIPSLEIGYTWYAQRVQRSALNTEAKRLLLGHAFDAMGCTVVELRTHVMNTRSRAAILRLGAHFDGVLRRNMRMPDGHLRDTAVYSILDVEWPDVRRNLDFRLEHGGSP